MKKVFLQVSLLLVLFSCSPADETLRNPYLPALNFSVRLDLNLPEYNQLNFPGNKYITHEYGINGIVIFNLNNSQYSAYELTDPNHIPKECSRLIVTGTEATCSCGDGNSYSIITGQPISGEAEYGLKPYRVIRRGNIIEISN